MFVTAEKERRMFIILFLSSFCQLLSPEFKLGQAERVQAMKALTNQPRSQLFLYYVGNQNSRNEKTM